MNRTRLVGAALLLLALGLVLGASGCGSGELTPRQIVLAPESELPDWGADMPANVKEAYRFAIANPEVLEYMPCFCGCNAVGHKSNLECYIKEVKADGSIEFDTHAFG